VKDPNARLGSGTTDAEEVKAHPWFATIDWAALENKTLQPPFIPQISDPADVSHFE
jgi:hypothetical protein